MHAPGCRRAACSFANFAWPVGPIFHRKRTCLSHGSRCCEMPCHNESSRGTISKRRSILTRSVGGATNRYLISEIGHRLKQLTGGVGHLCKDGITRILPETLP